MAERAGFEPALGLTLNTLSKRAPSTTRPPLHYETHNHAVEGPLNFARLREMATTRPPLHTPQKPSALHKPAQHKHNSPKLQEPPVHFPIKKIV